MLDASCTTHRLTFAVTVRPGTRVFAEIGAAALQRVKLRDGIGMLTLRPGSSLRAIRLVRKHTRRLSVEAPPAAAQCGWEAVPSITAR